MSNEEKEILNTEEKQTLDEVMVEKVVEETKETTDLKKAKEEKVEEAKKEVSPSIGRFLVGLVDQMVVASMSSIALFVFNMCLKLFGYRLATGLEVYLQAFLIVYIIINIFFPTICHICKFKGSFGTRIVYND